MRPIILILFSSLVLFTSCDNATVKPGAEDLLKSKESEIKKPTRLLRHVVLFNFNEAATDDIVKKIEEAFVGLPNQISEIHSFEWGINNSPEGLDKGLTHCFFVTFLSEEDRAIYLPHPAHQEFVDLVGPYVEDVTVVDYWMQ